MKSKTARRSTRRFIHTFGGVSPVTGKRGRTKRVVRRMMRKWRKDRQYGMH